MYKNSLEAARATLEEKMTQLKKEKTECMEEYINRALRLRLQLQTPDEPVSDQRIKRAILRGLPEEYEYVRETLLLQTNLSMEDLIQHLRSAESRLESKLSSEAAVLKAAVRKNMSKIQCYRCQEYGHFRTDCPKKQRGNRGNGRHGQAGAVAMTVSAKAGHGEFSAQKRHVADVSAAGKAGFHRDDGNIIKWVFDTGLAITYSGMSILPGMFSHVMCRSQWQMVAA
eukprot:jgi/Ulvmu1/9846/UM056_0088.1